MPFQVPIRRGEDHPFAKIPNSEREDCRRRFRAGERVTDLAAEKGITKGGMSKIVHSPAYSLRETKVSVKSKRVEREGPG